MHMLATSTLLRSPSKPSWQTDELEDEWIEQSSSQNHDHDHDHDKTSSNHSISIASGGRFNDATPPDTLSHQPSPPSPTPPGTFLIREDQLAAPILPQPLRKSKNKNLLKDFFSPLALETMFEPPSPQLPQTELPPAPSPLSQVDVAVGHQREPNVPETFEDEGNGVDQGLGEGDMEEETRPISEDRDKGGDVGNKDPEGEDVILASDIPNLISFDGRKPSSAYKFTFSAARPTRVPSTIPERTPSPSLSGKARPPLLQAPATDPRLRLFQFQYDTFTREHLSAMVDSIAVHTPSNSSKSKSPTSILSRVHTENLSSSTAEQPDAYLRATKRLRLTPPEDISRGSIPSAPRSRKDYIGESRNLMRKIKQARTPSMMTVASAKENVQPTNMEDQNTVEDRPRRVPFGDVRSMWSSDTPSDSSQSVQDPNLSPTPSSCLQPSTAHASTSLHPVYPTSTLTPSIPSSLFSSTSDSTSKPSSIASALGYRRQAADLMAQIRKDMTTGKRLVSLETIKDKTMDEEELKETSRSPQVSVTPASPRRTQKGQSNSLQTLLPAPTILTPLRAPADKDKHKLSRKSIGPSPRKLLRRLSAADEVDRELAMNQSSPDASFSVRLSKNEQVTQPKEQSLDDKYFPQASPSPQPSPQPPHLSFQPQSIQVFHLSAPAVSVADPRFLLPQAPSLNSEPNRVVSGGTTSSLETADSVLTRGTTATSATSVITGRTVSTGSVESAGSFVKHPGPVQMTRIGPEDLPSLPDMVGGMRFDRVLMRWVKAYPTKDGGVAKEEGELAALTEDSDDPFRSFESLDSGRVGEITDGQATVRNDDEASHVGDEGDGRESADNSLTAAISSLHHVDDDTDDSFDFDYDSGAAVVEVMTGVDSQSTDTDTETTDSEGDDIQPEQQDDMVDSASEADDGEEATVTAREIAEAASPDSSPVLPESYSTPIPAHRTGLVPPRSALKNGAGSLNHTTPHSEMRTPNNLFSSAHRRSVSFSDGRKDGKIKGLGRGVDEVSVAPSPALPVASSTTTTPFVPSARGTRIVAILEDLAEPSFEEQTPSKASTVSRSSKGIIQPLASHGPPAALVSSSRRPFSRSTKEKELSLAQGNQTFLTECSFGIAHDKLVHIVTDVHPFVPYWETLDQINLSNKGLDSVVRLKEYLPQLDALKLENNSLPWLTGIPNTVRTLSVASNVLTAMSSFNHLLNLENLDISNNHIDSLQQLSCLRHLRELKADGNAITSLDGLGNLDGLTKLSLKGNCISHADFGELRWPRLELLNLSRNGLRSASGLSSLSSLSALNLDHNHLVSLEADGPMPRLRTLRVSDNRLTRLDASRFTNLRTLYADNNKLCGVLGAQRLRKLENLSLRNQGGKGLTLATNDIRDVKRLYLSGNPLSCSFLDEPCYNLIYLEVAACRLTELPQDLARLVPNVRVLNLNYNFLTDARALDGLTRLRKLTLIGSRLKGTKALIRMLRRMPEVEMLDFRMNPCTLGWYLPILVQDVPGALQPSEDMRPGFDDLAEGGRSGPGAVVGGTPHSHAHSWQELDAKFRRDLPDEAYVGRLAYRGLVMRACPRVRMLDGVVVEAREQEKAERLLQGVLCAKAGKGLRA